MKEKARIRTITECVEMLHEEDPGNTIITVHGLRLLVARGEIPHRIVGRRVLLNYDIVRAYYMMDGYKPEGQVGHV